MFFHEINIEKVVPGENSNRIEKSPEGVKQKIMKPSNTGLR